MQALKEEDFGFPVHADVAGLPDARCSFELCTGRGYSLLMSSVPTLL